MEVGNTILVALSSGTFNLAIYDYGVVGRVEEPAKCCCLRCNNLKFITPNEPLICHPRKTRLDLEKSRKQTRIYGNMHMLRCAEKSSTGRVYLRWHFAAPLSLFGFCFERFFQSSSRRGNRKVCVIARIQKRRHIRNNLFTLNSNEIQLCPYRSIPLQPLKRIQNVDRATLA